MILDFCHCSFTRLCPGIMMPAMMYDQYGFAKIYQAPEGYDAIDVANAAKHAWQTHRRGVVYVVLDDQAADFACQYLRFFAPFVTALLLPAWDCLPYDRVSPRRDILARRAEVLTKIVQKSFSSPHVIVTTVNSFVQKVPPLNFFQSTALHLQTGADLDKNSLDQFLSDNGYVRSPTVREPGEFSIRGGIIDLFPATEERPIRLDLFGDEIDSLRYFHPVSQRSMEQIPSLSIGAATECKLSAEAIKNFRSGYREHFGAIREDDPLYEALGEGRSYPGMEHWLPLFLESNNKCKA